MIKSVVRQIGEKALNPEDSILILFDESATEELKKFSVIQKIKKDQPFDIKKGSRLLFDDHEYTVQHVGPVANEHLNTMGHVSIIFKDASEDNDMANALYLEPHKMPEIKEGTIITYIG
ncbi:MAG: PTS glucitol/sorbitol transporter subunit IIA [Vagococcus sp.]